LKKAFEAPGGGLEKDRDFQALQAFFFALGQKLKFEK
jgi:hypothetical protein